MITLMTVINSIDVNNGVIAQKSDSKMNAHMETKEQKYHVWYNTFTWCKRIAQLFMLIEKQKTGGNWTILRNPWIG